MSGPQPNQIRQARLVVFLLVLLFAGQTLNAQSTPSDEPQSITQALYLSTEAALHVESERVYTPQNTALTVRLPVEGGARPYTYIFPDNITGGQISLNGSLLTFNPAADFAGRSVINYQVADAYGQTEQARLTVDVGGTLAANSRFVTTEQGQSVAIFGLIRGGQPPYTITVDPEFVEQVTPLVDGGIRYTPPATFTGTQAFDVEITDATGSEVQSTVSVRVEAGQEQNDTDAANGVVLDEPPRVVDTALNTATLVNLGAADETSGTHYTITSPPLHGALVRVRTDRVLYVPTVGFSGQDLFEYTATDITGQQTSATVNVTVGDVPVSAAQAVRADVLSEAITITWDAPTAMHYAIIERRQAQQMWLEVGRVPATVGEFIDLDVDCNHSYRYRVILERDSGLRSAPVITPVRNTPPCISIDVHVERSDDGLRVNWSGNLAGITDISIERRTSAGNWQGIAAVPFAQGAFIDSELVCGEAYRYRVRVDGAAEQISPLTIPMIITCPPSITVPSNQTHTVGEAVNLVIDAVDVLARPLTFSATGLPPGLRIDPNAGVIGGVISADAQLTETYQPRVMVMAEGGEVAEVTFTWTVTHTQVVAPANLRTTGSLSTAPVQPTFIWDHPGPADDEQAAMQYRLLVYLDQNEIINTWYALDDICVNGVCTVQPDVFAGLLNGNYRWWVQVYDGTDTVWSDRDGKAFTVTVPAPTTPILLAPSGDVQSALTTFTWQADPNVLWYRVIIEGAVDEWVSADDACSTEVCTVNHTLQSGIYTWALVAWGPGGQRTIPETLDTTFFVQAAYPQPPTGIVVIPNQGRPTISWQADANALWYRLYIGRDDGLPFDEWYEGAQVCDDAGRCTVMPEIDWTSGTYAVWMQAWGPNGFSSIDGENTIESWGSGPDLVLPNTPPTIPTALTVMGDDAGLSVSWASGPHTTWYQLHIHDTDGNEIFAHWYRTDESGCGQPGQTCTVSTDAAVLQALQAGQTYTVSVRGWGPGGYGDPAEITYTP